MTTKHYSVGELASMAGVSVRTLHHYDRIGLLRPTSRTDAGYRRYGEEEALRLQQILFYKELDLSLEEIGEILDDPHFDLVRALHQHRTLLQQRARRLARLLETVDRTLHRLIEHFYPAPAEVYTGLAQTYTDHPEFRAFYERIAEGMADFLADAIRFYAERNLSGSA